MLGVEDCSSVSLGSGFCCAGLWVSKGVGEVLANSGVEFSVGATATAGVGVEGGFGDGVVDGVGV